MLDNVVLGPLNELFLAAFGTLKCFYLNSLLCFWVIRGSSSGSFLDN
jgi:hypothetical protein